MRTLNTFNAREILEQIDISAKEFNFPILDSEHFRLGNSRLTLFRDKGWFMTFQLIVFDVRLYSFVNMLYVFGKNLSPQGYQTSFELFQAPDDKPFEDDDGNTLLKLDDFSIIFNARRYDFSPSQDEYVNADILPELEMEPEARILRFLCHKLEGELFMDNNGILQILHRQPLMPFLILDDWSHPDISSGELPSDKSCFRTLAKALELDEPDHYIGHPDEFNTHWSNWLVPPLW